MHNRARSLAAGLKAVERTFAENWDEESLQRLMALKQELASETGTEALIEGFGLSSGRPSRSF
ncbi:DNA primase [Ahrensia sp. R2A130]|nr:DNA primase [Ahrensia sp. R2A130]